MHNPNRNGRGFRIGQGWDRHRLEVGRSCVLGGVHLTDCDRGPAGHSDGDAVCHALIDALLGALALGDIGTHFPPGEERWKNASGEELMERCMFLIRDRGYRVLNADATVILEQPKLGEWKERIRDRLSELMGMNRDALSLKAKTAEGLGPVGSGESVEAQAVVLLIPDRDGSVDSAS